jgi:hypothetical protein
LTENFNARAQRRKGARKQIFTKGNEGNEEKALSQERCKRRLAIF